MWFVLQTNYGAHRFPAVLRRCLGWAAPKLIKVEGWDVHTITFMQDNSIFPLGFFEQRVGCVVWLEKVHWRFIRCTSIFWAWLITLAWCCGILDSYPLPACIYFLSENVRDKLSLY